MASSYLLQYRIRRPGNNQDITLPKALKKRERKVELSGKKINLFRMLLSITENSGSYKQKIKIQKL